MLLEDLNTLKNKELAYYNYDFFYLDKLSDDEFLVEFRFLKIDVLPNFPFMKSETMRDYFL